MANRIRMSPKEAAEKLGRTTKTLTRWEKAGKLVADYSAPEKAYFVPENWLPGFTVPEPPQATEKVLGKPAPSDEPAEETPVETFNKLAAMVNSGDATAEQISRYTKMVADLQKIGAVAILAGKVMPLAELAKIQEEMLVEKESLEKWGTSLASKDKTLRATGDTYNAWDSELTKCEKKLDEDRIKANLVMKWCYDSVAVLTNVDKVNVELPDFPIKVEELEELEEWAKLDTTKKKMKSRKHPKRSKGKDTESLFCEGG